MERLCCEWYCNRSRKFFRLSSVLVVRSEALRPATFERQRSVYSADVSVASRICSIYSVATAIIPWGSLIVIFWSDVGMFGVVNGEGKRIKKF